MLFEPTEKNGLPMDQRGEEIYHWVIYTAAGTTYASMEMSSSSTAWTE